jgi:hypothetical protein
VDIMRPGSGFGIGSENFEAVKNVSYHICCREEEAGFRSHQKVDPRNENVVEIQARITEQQSTGSQELATCPSSLETQWAVECDQQPAAEQQQAEQQQVEQAPAEHQQVEQAPVEQQQVEQAPLELQQVEQDKVEPLPVAQELVGWDRGDKVERNAREKRRQEVFSLQHSRIQEQGDK